MTPAARVAAAIEILDRVFAGASAEKTLSTWGRSNRFAGSKDRAAIRDHVFQALRCKRSYGWIGGSDTGRGVMLGAMHEAGQIAEVFTGVGHAPAPMAQGEALRDLGDAQRGVRADIPDWMLPLFDEVYGARADAIMGQLRSRAGVFLRVNQRMGSAAEAQAALREEGIETQLMQDMSFALQVHENERKVSGSRAFQSGLVEVQDVSSQAAIGALDVAQGQRVLDYCAGGGGKALALAARGAEVSAYDLDPRRMVDIAPRAARAQVRIATLLQSQLSQQKPFELVLCDAPCSGSGTWRRTPQAKWDLTQDRLQELTDIQDDVLDKAMGHVAAGGVLAYATCSVFECENEGRAMAFERKTGWPRLSEMRLDPGPTGDGFYLVQFQKP